jgi:lipopolysaccharide transport protein LptA
MFIKGVLLLLLILSTALSVHAQTPPKEEARKDYTTNVFSLSSAGPLSISSERITVKGLEDAVLFEGNVAIKKGDMTISAGQAEVFLFPLPHAAVDPAEPNASSTSGEKEISRIELAGEVDLKQGNRRVLAQKGVYHAKQGEITFTGGAEMWEPGYHVKGKVITLSLTQRRTQVESSQLTID